MTWDMIREMRKSGMGVGGHTVSHPVLARLTPERQKNEIRGCGDRIAQEMQESMQCFSYPVGGSRAFDHVSRRCLQEAGVKYAFSYYGGFRRFAEWDDYDIRRVAIETDMTDEWFKTMATVPGLLA